MSYIMKYGNKYDVEIGMSPEILLLKRRLIETQKSHALETLELERLNDEKKNGSRQEYIDLLILKQEVVVKLAEWEVNDISRQLSVKK